MLLNKTSALLFSVISHVRCSKFIFRQHTS